MICCVVHCRCQIWTIEGYDIPEPWLEGLLYITAVVHSRVIPWLALLEQLLIDRHPSCSPFSKQRSAPSFLFIFLSSFSIFALKECSFFSSSSIIPSTFRKSSQAGKETLKHWACTWRTFVTFLNIQ